MKPLMRHAYAPPRISTASLIVGGVDNKFRFFGVNFEFLVVVSFTTDHDQQLYTHFTYPHVFPIFCLFLPIPHKNWEHESKHSFQFRSRDQVNSCLSVQILSSHHGHKGIMALVFNPIETGLRKKPGRGT